MLIGFDFDGTLHELDLTSNLLTKTLVKKHGYFSKIYFFILKVLVKIKFLKKGDDLKIIFEKYEILTSDFDVNKNKIKWKPLYNFYKKINIIDNKVIISGCLDFILFKLFPNDNLFCSETEIVNNRIKLIKFNDFEEKEKIAKKLKVDIYFGDKNGDLHVRQ